MIRNFLLFLAAALITAACTVTEEITFNKNFSGSGFFTYNVDSFGDDEENDSTLMAQMAMAEEYKAAASDIPGIGNVRYVFDDELMLMRIDFAFDGLAALNALYKLDVFEEAPFLRKEFARKGSKKLSMTWPVHQLTDEDREAFDNEMMDMYTHELTLNLPREIRKSTFADEKIAMETSGQRVFFKGTWGNFYTHTQPLVYSVKMK